jgi:hypothetical protein
MWIELIFILIAFHAVADFALQTPLMAKLKNRHNKPDDIPNGQKSVPTWPFWLSAHGLIHGILVYFATGIVWFGITETIIHCIIDFAKCENVTNPYQDQILHYLSKIPYIIVVMI